MPKIEVQWEWLWPVPPRPVIPARSKRESILLFLRGDGKDGSPLKTARMTDGGFTNHTEFWLLAMVRTPLRRGEPHATHLAIGWDGFPKTLNSVWSCFRRWYSREWLVARNTIVEHLVGQYLGGI